MGDRQRTLSGLSEDSTGGPEKRWFPGPQVSGLSWFPGPQVSGQSADSQRSSAELSGLSGGLVASFFLVFRIGGGHEGGVVGFVSFGHTFDEIQPEIQISADLFQIDSIRHSSLQQLISHV